MFGMIWLLTLACFNDYNSGVDPDGDGAPWPDDCDSTNPNIYPGAPELCDQIDQDCDGALWDPDDLTGVVTVSNSEDYPGALRSSITAGLAEAGAGGTVCVAPGMYREAVTLAAPVTLLSLAGAEETGVQPQDAFTQVMRILPGAAGSTVRGFTLTGGDTPGGQGLPSSCGGGLVVRGDATLESLNITGNGGFEGAGLCVLAGDVTLTDSVISFNTSVGAGGGVEVYLDPDDPQPAHLTMNDVRVELNEARLWGGGVYVHAQTLTATLVVVEGNVITEGGWGAGVAALESAEMTLNDVRIWSNSFGASGTGGAGGLYAAPYSEDLEQRVPTVRGERVDIRDNRPPTGGLGGALVCVGCQLTMSNMIVAGNSGDRILAIEVYDNTVSLDHLTVVGNQGQIYAGGLDVYFDGEQPASVSRSTFFQNTGEAPAINISFNSEDALIAQLSAFDEVHHDQNSVEFDPSAYGDAASGFFTDCTPAFVSLTGNATTWDLHLTDADRCLTTGAVELGAYGGAGGESWPAESAWP